jgi:hypothetical protein
MPFGLKKRCTQNSDNEPYSFSDNEPYSACARPMDETVTVTRP